MPTTNKSRLLSFAICILLSRACAFASTWDIFSSVFSASGNPAVTAGALASASCVGETLAAPQASVSGAENLLSGYLSQLYANTGDPYLVSFAPTYEPLNGYFMNGEEWGTLSAGNLGVEFSNDMDTATFSSGVQVTEVTDRLSNDLSTASYYSIATESEYTPVFEISPSTQTWHKGSTYEVHFTTGVADINGVHLTTTTEAKRYFTVIRDYAADNRAGVSGDKLTNVWLPADALSKDYFLSFATSTAGMDAANEKLAATYGSDRQVVKALNTAVYDSSNSLITETLAQNARISFSYQDDNNDGYLDGTDSTLRSVSDLSIWWLYPVQDRWVKLAQNFTLDTTEKQLSVYTASISTMSLVSKAKHDVSEMFAYPVPFRPNGPNAGTDRHQTGTWDMGICFTSPPDDGKLKIYTITGDLVREIDIADARLSGSASKCVSGNYLTEVNWDVKNSDGEVVASGVYIWEVKSGGNRKTGKLMVIK